MTLRPFSILHRIAVKWVKQLSHNSVLFTYLTHEKLKIGVWDAVLDYCRFGTADPRNAPWI